MRLLWIFVTAMVMVGGGAGAQSKSAPTQSHPAKVAPAASKKVAGTVRSVLSVRCKDASEKSGNKHLTATLDPVVADTSADADNALAALAGYYLGEEGTLRVGGAVIDRGKRMIPLLNKYEKLAPIVAAPCKDLLQSQEWRRAAYESLRGSIE
jgi:hypothetical protein